MILIVILSPIPHFFFLSSAEMLQKASFFIAPRRFVIVQKFILPNFCVLARGHKKISRARFSASELNLIAGPIVDEG